MSVTGLKVFDATVHKTNAWLKRLIAIGGWDDRHLACFCLRATLHALRDRFTVEEVAELAAQLPMPVRGFYPGAMATPALGKPVIGRTGVG